MGMNIVDVQDIFQLGVLGTETQVVQDRISLLKLELDGRALLVDDGLDGVEVLVAGGGFINLLKEIHKSANRLLGTNFNFCFVLPSS